MAARKSDTKLYVIDTNVLIHDPAAILNFEEHQVVIPMTVLEELDKLKMGKASIATDCREAIRQIDRIIGDASPTEIAKGIPIERPDGDYQGHFSILLDTFHTPSRALPDDLNDNKIINSLETKNRQLFICVCNRHFYGVQLCQIVGVLIHVNGVLRPYWVAIND